MSVGFADKDSLYYIEHGYIEIISEAGRVYIPDEQVEITGKITIRYEKYPWIEKFEIDGVVPKPIKRTGYGTKDCKGFVQSLNTIYAKAYQEYSESINDAKFFSKVAEKFVRSFIEENEIKMFVKFCGFTENMWREGNKEMCDIAIKNILPILKKDEEAWQKFIETITQEFQSYIEK